MGCLFFMQPMDNRPEAPPRADLFRRRGTAFHGVLGWVVPVAPAAGTINFFMFLEHIK